MGEEKREDDRETQGRRADTAPVRQDTRREATLRQPRLLTDAERAELEHALRAQASPITGE